MIPDDQRKMPQTRPDEEALGHKIRCLCTVCKRPTTADLKRRQHRAQIRTASRTV